MAQNEAEQLGLMDEGALLANLRTDLTFRFSPRLLPADVVERDMNHVVEQEFHIIPAGRKFETEAAKS